MQEWEPWITNSSININSISINYTEDTLSCIHLSHKSLLNKLTDVKKAKQSQCQIKHHGINVYMVVNIELQVH